MKSLVKIISSLVFLLAVFLTIFSYREIKDYFSVFKGNLAFSEGKFIEAQSNYIGVSELGLSENNQNILDFNTANTFYGDKNFSGALMYYSKVKDLNPDILYVKFHNVGNSLYKLGLLQDEYVRVNTWQKSIGTYEIALKSKTLSDKKDTIANYEFVKKELEKLKKKLKDKEEEEKKKQEQNEPKKENSSSGSENKPKEQEKPKEDPKKPDDKKTGENSPKPEEKQKSWTVKGSFNQLGQNGAENSEKMSPDEKKELDQYSAYLKQFQKENLGNVQKGTAAPQNNIQNDAINNMLREPDFTDFSPNVGKDW